VGRVHYHAPPTYWPTLRALGPLLRAARTSAPTLSPFESDTVLAWALHHLVAMPLVAVGWPLYWLSMVGIILPIAVLLCAAGAIVLLPFGVLSRFTFSETAPPSVSSLFRGELPDEGARMFLWLIASLLVVPMAFCGRLLRATD